MAPRQLLPRPGQELERKHPGLVGRAVNVFVDSLGRECFFLSDAEVAENREKAYGALSDWLLSKGSGVDPDVSHPVPWTQVCHAARQPRRRNFQV